MLSKAHKFALCVLGLALDILFVGLSYMQATTD